MMEIRFLVDPSLSLTFGGSIGVRPALCVQHTRQQLPTGRLCQLVSPNDHCNWHPVTSTNQSCWQPLYTGHNELLQVDQCLRYSQHKGCNCSEQANRNFFQVLTRQVASQWSRALIFDVQSVLHSGYLKEPYHALSPPRGVEHVNRTVLSMLAYTTNNITQFA